MKQGTKKKLAVITMSTVMAACVAGGVGYAKMNHAVLASADTASYAVLQRTAQSWRDVKFSVNSPVTLRLENVAAGQYCVTVKVTAVAGSSQDYYVVTATGTGESVFLSMSSAEGEEATYYGVVTVSENGELTLNTTSENELTADVSLDSLFLSEGNGFYLQDVQIPAAVMGEPTPLGIDIVNPTARNFTVQVDLGERRLTEDETLIASIGGTNKVLTRLENTDFNTYSATIELPDGATASQLTLTSTSTDALVGTVSLYQLGAITRIENNTATATGVNVWNTAIFSYTSATPKYVTAKITSDPAAVSVSTIVGKSAGNYSGSPVASETYPIYIEAGETYYFEVTLENIDSTTATSANLTITISDWVRPTIEVGGTYAIPVTPEAQSEHETFDLNAAADTYDLTITEVPFDYYLTGVIVTAHITYAAEEGVAPAVQEVVLNSNNNYSEEVEIAANVESIYFTTTQESRSVISITLTIPEVINYIVPGTPKTINVPANGSITYFIEAAHAGVYSLELTNTSSSVSVMVGDVTIIPAGKTRGGFVVQYEGNDFGITFVNSSSAEVEITAEVALETADTTIQLDTAKSITLAANQRQAFFMYSLAAGTFDLSITPATTTGVTLEVDGVPVTITNGKATITISEVQDTNGLVNFTFESTAAATFNVTVTPQNIVEAGKEFSITTSGYYYYVAYYVKGLEANTEYYMVLDLPEGVSATVTQNGTDLIYYGNAIGTFRTTGDGYVTLRFSLYAYGNATTIKAYIDKYTANTVGTMTVNTATDITVEGRYASYTLDLTEGLYYISVLGDVEATINGTLVSNSISYYAYGDEQVRVTFINFTGATATATATVVTDVITVGLGTSVTLAADSSKVYGIDLEKGVFTLTLSENENVEVQLDGVVVAPENGTYRLDVTMGGGHTLTFVNTGASEVSFTATVTPNNLLVLGEEKEITVSAGSSESYYIDLEAGSYTITLTFVDGTEVEVLLNGEQIVYPGDTTGEIDVQINGYQILTFVAETDVTFNVIVTVNE